jgi:hypothetical protein
MNLSVASPLYWKLGVLAFAVALLCLSAVPALVSVANYLADAGKVLIGVSLLSITGNAAAAAKEAAEAKAKAEAVVKAVE